MAKDIVPGHFSYSSLSSYMQCGQRYFLEKIAKVPEVPSWWLVGGSAVHTLTEIYDLDREKFQESGLDQLWSEVFNAEVAAQAERFPDLTVWRSAGKKKANPDGEDYLVWMDQGPRFVQNYIDWRESSGLEIWDGAIAGYDPETNSFEPYGPAVELALDIEIHGWKFKGSVDRVFEVPSGDLLVLDLKSGSRMPDNTLQLGTYAVGVEKQYGQRPKWGQYFNLRQNKLSNPENLSRYTLDSIGQLGVQFKAGIQNKVFLPHESNLCGSCAVNKGCSAYGGEDAHLYTIEKVLGGK